MVDRPGPQPWNRDVAPTLAEQLAKVQRPRPARPYPATVADRLAATIRAQPDLFRPILATLLAEDIGRMIAMMGGADGR